MIQNNEDLFKSLLLNLEAKSCLVDLAPANQHAIAYLATCNQVTFVAYRPFGSDELIISRGVNSISSKDSPLAEEIFSLVVEQEEAKALQKLSIGRIKHGDYGIPKFNQTISEETQEGSDETTPKGSNSGENSGDNPTEGNQDPNLTPGATEIKGTDGQLPTDDGNSG